MAITPPGEPTPAPATTSTRPASAELAVGAALAEPISGLFREEYGRFMGGLDRLTWNDRETMMKATRRDIYNASQPRVIAIPQWDDVLHVAPRLATTKEQWREYFTAQREGRAPNLDPEVAQAIQKRAYRLDAMSRSPQPAFDQAFGSVMTAIDNVQDFLGSVSVLGRVLLTLGPRIGLRAIPGLGAVILAADVLSTAMLIGQFAFPTWLALCAGPRAALRAGIGTALTHVGIKGSTALLARTSAKGLSFTLRTEIAAAKISGLLGAALVIGQTTDQLFGYGISLGPIVGGIMGAVYGAEATTRGVPVEVRSGPSVAHIRPRVQARLDGLPTTALLDRLRAAEILATAGLVFHEQSPATHEERLLTMTALLPALGVLWDDYSGSGWQDDLYRLADWHVPPPPRPYDPVTWLDLPNASANLLAQQWPRGWGGMGYIADQALNVAPGAIAAGLDAAMEHYRPAVEATYLGAALTDGTEQLWMLLTEDPTSFRKELTPSWLALERMTAAGMLPHPATTEEAFAPAWDAATTAVENRRHALKTASAWAELFDQHGIDYVRVLPALYEQD